MLEQSPQQSPEEAHRAFAQARMVRGVFGGAFCQVISQETPLFGPWMLELPGKLVRCAAIVGAAGERDLHESLVESALTAGLSAKRFVSYEQATVQRLFNGTQCPDSNGALRDNAVQREIADAAHRELLALAAPLRKLSTDISARHQATYDHLMSEAYEVERERRKLCAKLGLDSEARSEKPRGTSEPAAATCSVSETIVRLIDLRPDAQNARERELFDETIAWLANVREVHQAAPPALSRIGALKDAAEHLDRLMTGFNNILNLARDRAAGRDPWYELIQYETNAAMQVRRKNG